MALPESSNNIVKKDALKTLYNKAKAERTRWGLGDTTVPTDFFLVQNSYITEIRDLIDDMAGISFLSTVADTSGVTLPAARSVVSFTQGNQLFDILLNIENTFGTESVTARATCVSVGTTRTGTASRSGFNASGFCSSVTSTSNSSRTGSAGTCVGWSTGNCSVSMNFHFFSPVNSSVNSPVNSTVGSGGGSTTFSGFRSSVTSFSTYFGSDFATRASNSAVQVAGFCSSFTKGA